MFEGLEFDSAIRRIDDWQEGFEERRRRAQELSGRLADLCVTVSSESGLVEVSVGSRGELRDLTLEEASESAPPRIRPRRS